MLCETCTGVLQHRRNVVKIQTDEQSSSSDRASSVTCGHHLTCESLVAAAANGCPICQPTWEGLSDSQQGSLRAFGSEGNIDIIGTGPLFRFITFAQLSSERISKKLSFKIMYNFIWFPDLRLSEYGDFILERKRDSSTPYYPTMHASYQAMNIHAQHAATEGRFTTDHTSSMASLQMADMWLRDCIRSHQCNSHQRDNPWYPTRLLHLSEPYENEDYVSLMSTAEKSPDGPYATLSHRWGNDQPLQLTQSMASNPNHRFSMGDMPKTFQEVIQVSRRLGIRYLWIDTLCIIQKDDGRRDWYHEATLMDKVYLHSHLNIYAADAADSTKGLFRQRLPLRVGCEHVTVNLKDIEPGPEFTDCILIDRRLWSRNLEKSPLNNRGWVLQERYLAPRVLYFCRNQLFWECKEHIACETFPDGLLDGKLASMKLWEKANPSPPGTQSQERWIFTWDFGIVSAYSKMDLTFQSDKLIALSGIAKFVMGYLNDTYVAGMWRSRLEGSLLWYGCSTSPQPRPLVYRAPSWSWASMDGAIEHFLPSYGHSRIQVMDVVISHATEDTTGAVTDGWLDLRGVLKPLRLRKIKESDMMPRMVLDNTTISSQHGTIEKSASMMSGIHLDFLPNSHYSRIDDNVQGRLFYMPCQFDGSRSLMICLLLKLVDKDKTLFERFGISWTYEPAEIEQLLVDLDEDTKAHLPCLRYENGLHTIRII